MTKTLMERNRERIARIREENLRLRPLGKRGRPKGSKRPAAAAPMNEPWDDRFRAMFHPPQTPDDMRRQIEQAIKQAARRKTGGS